MVLIVTFLRRALGVLRPIRGYALLLILPAAWDVLFSPFALRPRWAVVFCICVFSLAHLRRRAASPDPDQGQVGDWDGTWEMETDGLTSSVHAPRRARRGADVVGSTMPARWR